MPDVDKACERFEELGVEFVKKPNAGNMKGLAFIKVLSLCSSTISTFACLVSCYSAKVEAPSTTCWYAGPRWLLDRDLERPELDKIGVGVECHYSWETHWRIHCVTLRPWLYEMLVQQHWQQTAWLHSLQ